MNAPSHRRILTKASWVCRACRSRFSTTTILRAKKNKFSLPESPARTRFAPSPTGYLHLGSLRTALFNYLLAKRTGGQFLLRIEDTDQKRTVPGAEQRLYDDLQWAGLKWDEGPVVGGPYGPYRQSERNSLYRSQTLNLISSGHAYRCFCSPERLDTLARHRNDIGLPPGYDGTCTGIPKDQSDERAENGDPHVVRLRVSEPYPMFNDLVYGKTGQNRPASQREGYTDTFIDPILLKSDGHPTYHLANVVDDHFMKITHVIRGTEWMSSTPMHMALYNAFKWAPPKFGHVPLLVEKNGQKLSKRNADIDISSFKGEKGIFPETLVNFAALLGWSHTGKSDVFNLAELEEIFDLKLTKGNTIVAFEKMWFLQKAHAQRYAAQGGPGFDDMVRRVVMTAEKEFSQETLSPILKTRTMNEYISSILREGARSYTNATDFLAQNKSFFTQTIDRPPYTPTKLTPKQSDSVEPNAQPAPEVSIPISSLHTAAAALSMVPEQFWTADTHRSNIAAYIFSSDTQLTSDVGSSSAKIDKMYKKELYNYLRWALSGGAPGLGIPATMAILGRDETVRRLNEAKEATKDLVSDSESTTKREAGDDSSKSNAWMGSLAGMGR